MNTTATPRKIGPAPAMTSCSNPWLLHTGHAGALTEDAVEVGIESNSQGTPRRVTATLRVKAGAETATAALTKSVDLVKDRIVKALQDCEDHKRYTEALSRHKNASRKVEQHRLARDKAEVALRTEMGSPEPDPLKIVSLKKTLKEADEVFTAAEEGLAMLTGECQQFHQAAAAALEEIGAAQSREYRGELQRQSVATVESILSKIGSDLTLLAAIKETDSKLGMGSWRQHVGGLVPPAPISPTDQPTASKDDDEIDFAATIRANMAQRGRVTAASP